VDAATRWVWRVETQQAARLRAVEHAHRAETEVVAAERAERAAHASAPQIEAAPLPTRLAGLRYQGIGPPVDAEPPRTVIAGAAGLRLAGWEAELARSEAERVRADAESAPATPAVVATDVRLEPDAERVRTGRRRRFAIAATIAALTSLAVA